MCLYECISVRVYVCESFVSSVHDGLNAFMCCVCACVCVCINQYVCCICIDKTRPMCVHVPTFKPI